ncbi:hypothetical protein IFM89_023641 [Coptis chinensis]|uniref:O-fucosyltransferase family protein n=1 Tax=Coptis chinensis TaxID=261450 RepID=A0A835HWW8_9MAGN|nr:hypothetical protein IFM89_023641 [Coptis chinensis]
MNFDNSTRIYIAAGELFGGERFMKPFRTLFPHLENHSTVGPSDELVENTRGLLGSAVDYMVCLLADIFMPTYDGPSNFANNVMGHRLYYGFRTIIQPDRKALAPIFIDRENGRTAGFEEAVRHVMQKTQFGGPHKRVRPESVFTNSWPECFCQTSPQNPADKCPPENVVEVLNSKMHGEETDGKETEHTLALFGPALVEDLSDVLFAELAEMRLITVHSFGSFEVGVILSAMNFDNSTRIYIVAGKLFGGRRLMKPFQTLFPHLENHSTVGPSDELVENTRGLLGSAVDYMVCRLADIFMPTYDGPSNFANNVMWHHLYYGFHTIIQPDRKALAPIIIDRENHRTTGFEEALNPADKCPPENVVGVLNSKMHGEETDGKETNSLNLTVLTDSTAK